MSPLMRELASLLFIHVWLVGFGYGIYNTLWGKGKDLEKTHEDLMKSPVDRFFLSGRLRDKKVWANQQRILAWLAIPFISFIYVGMLISILNGQYMF